MEKAKIKSILGKEKEIAIGWPRSEKWWDIKFYVLECKKCASFIGKNKATEIIKKLEEKKTELMRWQAPKAEDTFGICVWGVAPKILVRRKRGLLEKCVIHCGKREK